MLTIPVLVRARAKSLLGWFKRPRGNSKVPHPIPLRLELLETRTVPTYIPTSTVTAVPHVFYPTTNSLESDNIKYEYRPLPGTLVARATLRALPFGANPDTVDAGPDFGSEPPGPQGVTTLAEFFTGDEWRVRWVNESLFHRPGMQVVDQLTGRSYPDVTYIAIARRVGQEFVDVCAAYCDGSIRLAAAFAGGRKFTDTVLVGPATVVTNPTTGEVRPYADVTRLTFDPLTMRLNWQFAAGGSATGVLSSPVGAYTQLDMTALAYDQNAGALWYESMNTRRDVRADVQVLSYVDPSGATLTRHVTSFTGGPGNCFIFFKNTRTDHNANGGNTSLVFDAEPITIMPNLFFEAEDATPSGPQGQRDNASGHGNFHLTRKLSGGGSVSVPFSVGAAGDYTIGVRYSFDNSNAAAVTLRVDGKVIGSFVPVQTGSGGQGWNVFESAAVAPATLSAGSHTLTVSYSETGANQFGIELDTFFVAGIAADAPPSISAISAQVVPADGSGTPINFTVSDAVTPAAALVVSVASSDPALLPPGGLAIFDLGSSRSLVITPAVGQSGTARVTVTVTDGGGLTATSSFDVLVKRIPPVLPDAVAVGSGSGREAAVRAFNPPGGAEPMAFESPFPGFTGGVRTAVADINGDGAGDLILGSGPGMDSRVTVVDGKTKTVLFTGSPFSGFTGGVFVASADINGDGFDDIIITPDEGGGPRVTILSGKDGSVLSNFFAIDDANFRGGARAAAGDVNGDGTPDLVVSAGFGGGPRIAVYDGKSLGGTPTKLMGDFFAFEPALRNGAYVAVGDLNGDGKDDLIFGGGPGGGPRVLALDSAAMLGGSQTVLANFFAGNPDNRGGVRLAAKNIDGDSNADLVTGDGDGAGSLVTAYAGQGLVVGDATNPLFAFDAFPGSFGGVFVG